MKEISFSGDTMFFLADRRFIPSPWESYKFWYFHIFSFNIFTIEFKRSKVSLILSLSYCHSFLVNKLCHLKFNWLNHYKCYKTSFFLKDTFLLSEKHNDIHQMSAFISFLIKYFEKYIS